MIKEFCKMKCSIKQIVIIFIMLCLPLLVYGDIITLKAGDRISGKLIAIKQGNVIFNSPSLGKLKINNQSINTIQTDDEVYLKSGVDYSKGMISTSPSKQIVFIRSDSFELIKIDLEDDLLNITNAIPAPAPASAPKVLSPAKKTKVNYSIELGANNSRGNSITENITGKSNLTIKYSIHKLTFDIFKTSTKNAEVTSKNESKFKSRYDLSLRPAFYLYLKQEFEHDKFRSLSMRELSGTGLGVNLLNYVNKPASANIKLEFGITYIATKLTTGIRNRKKNTRYANTIQYKFNKKLNISNKSEYLPNYDRAKDYLFNNDFSVKIQINEYLYMNIGNNLKYDSIPTTTTQKKSDYTNFITLGVSL